MDPLKAARRTFRSRQTRLITKLEAELELENPDVIQIRTTLEQLMTNREELASKDKLILERLWEADASELEIDEESDTVLDYDDKYLRARTTAETYLDSVDKRPGHSPVPSEAVSGRSNVRNVRLPKIELRKFNSQLQDWLPFWTSFQKIHENPDIFAADKFHYLLQSMEKGTEAFDLVSAYPQSAENYPEVIDALKARYGDEDLLLQVYVRELLKLVISNAGAKEKLTLPQLFLKLDSHLRSLKTLDLASKDPATWLYPLVESCLPEETLLVWQRVALTSLGGASQSPPSPTKTKLDSLMEFLKGEVSIQQKILLAKTSFETLNEKKEFPSERKTGKPGKSKVPTISGFQNVNMKLCIFCDKAHDSKECFKAQGLSIADRWSRVRDKKRCGACLLPDHYSAACKAKIRCLICGDRHVTIMCPKLVTKKPQAPLPEVSKVTIPNDANGEKAAVELGSSNQVCTAAVVLQTLMVTISAGGREKTVRAFLDNGSQRSYVLKRTAKELNLKSTHGEQICHALFGGVHSENTFHSCYDIRIKKPGGSFSIDISVRDQEKICDRIPRVSPKTPRLFQELKKHRIYISDIGNDCPEVELLIGMDVWVKLFTGKSVELGGGLVAMRTKIGWTLAGEVVSDPGESIASLVVMSATVQESRIAKLWDLESLGIKDPVEVSSESTRVLRAKEEFFRCLTRDEEGRYVAALPWVPNHPLLPSNREIAQKRLATITKKLDEKGFLESYGNIFKEWEAEGFIERVLCVGSEGSVHYLPHHPVFKDSPTTPVRPVFDASCRARGRPSLNDCLEKGCSYIHVIPELLLRFRQKEVAFTSDIRKAFQMIRVKAEDRDRLRFLWWEDCKKGSVVEYRHARVIFGATCSPFILGAVIEHHLRNAPAEYQNTASLLLNSFYVDNCVLSVDTFEEYERFKEEAIRLMQDAKMDLRLWMSNKDEFTDSDEVETSILGLLWNRKDDCLSIKTGASLVQETVTKRVILSSISRIFDPLGFLSPALIQAKIILQTAWISKLGWDEVLPSEISERFHRWLSEFHVLGSVRVPRLLAADASNKDNWTIHAFADASAAAFAAAVFIQVKESLGCRVQLLLAKSRVAPVKKITIPRLELMGCLIASRLVSLVKKSLRADGVRTVFWSDSTTALAWIKRNENWSIFVRNRVQEIRASSSADEWRFIPGNQNPADLLSRGCSPSHLISSRWWEGPQFLKEWTAGKYELDVAQPVCEDLVMEERVGSTLELIGMTIFDSVRCDRTFEQMVRIFAWVKRFVHNAKVKDKGLQRKGELTFQEIADGRRIVIRLIQAESFPDGKVFSVSTIKDEHGLLRVKTRIIFRNDLVDFKYPYLLPRKHPMVQKLILSSHRTFCHAGVSFLLSKLREEFWILQGRRAVKQSLNQCLRCQRFKAKPTVVETAPLPEDRIKNAEAFEIVGVDLAGPLQLRGNSKAWVVMYTCAVYRAVHLDVVTSLSSKAFIESLKRFCMRRRRPSVVYSDNGTNFIGANNLFSNLDWNEVTKDEAAAKIDWKFNPPAAPWWGGFWERMIRSMKDLMRRMIGQATLKKDELVWILFKIEEVLNHRPITYLSEDPNDLLPLTPAMFLQPDVTFKFPEEELTESQMMRIRLKYLKELQLEIRGRFRKEYLALLVQRPSQRKPTRQLNEGDLVLVSTENKRKFEWPLARVLQLIPGRDGIPRVARIRTQKGELLRPIQRLCRLELDTDAHKSTPSPKIQSMGSADFEVTTSKPVGGNVKYK